MERNEEAIGYVEKTAIKWIVVAFPCVAVAFAFRDGEKFIFVNASERYDFLNSIESVMKN